jgi:hypothetical protein
VYLRTSHTELKCKELHDARVHLGKGMNHQLLKKCTAMYRNLEIHYHVHNSLPLAPNLIYIGCPESKDTNAIKLFKNSFKNPVKKLFNTYI